MAATLARLLRTGVLRDISELLGYEREREGQTATSGDVPGLVARRLLIALNPDSSTIVTNPTCRISYWDHKMCSLATRFVYACGYAIYIAKCSIMIQVLLNACGG